MFILFYKAQTWDWLSCKVFNVNVAVEGFLSTFKMLKFN